MTDTTTTDTEIRTGYRTLPLCTGCWTILNPERMPVQVRDADREKCVWCGERTRSGIYVRGQIRIRVFPVSDRGSGSGSGGTE